MKEANVILKKLNNEQMSDEQYQLKKNGYKRIENCYWVEIWEKDGWTVQLERE